MFGLATILLALAAQSAAPVPPPPGIYGLPTESVDHVAVMNDWRADCSNCQARRRTITRSGRWVKDETVELDGIVTIYSDFGSGTSITLRRNREGVLDTLLVERNFDPEPVGHLRRERTGRSDTALSETCEIWALTSALLGTATESCETADGIPLWTRHRERVYSRAVSVQRRIVRPEEARPPVDLFDQIGWPQLDLVEAGSQSGYEVRLASRSRGVERTTVLRGQGHFRSGSREGRRDEGWHYWATDGTSSYSYQVDRRGRAIRLEGGRPRHRIGLGSPRWEAVANRGPVRVLGERCIWQEDMSFQSTDTVYQCRTDDGLPLMLEFDWHWDSVTDIYRARRVSRRPLRVVDVAVPHEAVDWGTWGVSLH
jgi:hypothetical protein